MSYNNIDVTPIINNIEEYVQNYRTVSDCCIRIAKAIAMSDDPEIRKLIQNKLDMGITISTVLDTSICRWIKQFNSLYIRAHRDSQLSFNVIGDNIQCIISDIIKYRDTHYIEKLEAFSYWSYTKDHHETLIDVVSSYDIVNAKDLLESYVIGG